MSRVDRSGRFRVTLSSLTTLHLFSAKGAYEGVVVAAKPRDVVGFKPGSSLGRLRLVQRGRWRSISSRARIDRALTLSSARGRLVKDKQAAVIAVKAFLAPSAPSSRLPAASSAPSQNFVASMTPIAPATPVGSQEPAAVPARVSPIADTELARRIAALRLMNYQPATHAWSAMWTDWRPDELNRDFARIAALNANVVRLTVMPWVTGYPTPRDDMLARLHAAIDIAAAHGLAVQLTLFDWWGSYGDLDGSRAWARAVLSSLPGDSRVAFIELKNEIDPGDEAQMAWARQMLPFVQSMTGQPVTLSISSSLGVAGLRALKDKLGTAQPDFFDLHYYEAGNAGLAYSVLSAAEQVAAPKPLFIGESGFSTKTSVSGLPASTPAQEAYQALYLRTVFAAARALGLPAPGVWTLNDFASGAIPSGTATAASPIEYHYGLDRVDGSPKPAADVVASEFAGEASADFNGDFEDAVTSGGGQSFPAQWTSFAASSGRLSLDTTFAHSGRGSVRLAGTGASESGYPAIAAVPPVAVMAGRTYSASAWAAGASATGTSLVSISWFDANNQYLGQAQSAVVAQGTSTWRKLSATAPAPTGVAYAKVFLKSGNNTGVVWFDDVGFDAMG